MSAQMCCKSVRIPGSWPRYKACKNRATVEVDGQHYCGVHNPISRKRREEERDQEWRKKNEQRARLYRLHAAAPDLLEALRPMTQGTYFITAEHVEAARAAIAKATGESP